MHGMIGPEASIRAEDREDDEVAFAFNRVLARVANLGRTAAQPAEPVGGDHGCASRRRLGLVAVDAGSLPPRLFCSGWRNRSSRIL